MLDCKFYTHCVGCLSIVNFTPTAWVLYTRGFTLPPLIKGGLGGLKARDAVPPRSGLHDETAVDGDDLSGDVFRFK